MLFGLHAWLRENRTAQSLACCALLLLLQVDIHVSGAIPANVSPVCSSARRKSTPAWDTSLTCTPTGSISPQRGRRSGLAQLGARHRSLSNLSSQQTGAKVCSFIICPSCRVGQTVS